MPKKLDDQTPDSRRDSRAYTDDEAVAEAFDEGVDDIQEAPDLEELQGLDLSLAAGDADVEQSFIELEDANTVGQDGIAGAQPPPDASVVEEIGKAVGLQYQDDEQLDIRRKIEERDGSNRWELRPASSEDWPRKS